MKTIANKLQGNLITPAHPVWCSYAAPGVSPIKWTIGELHEIRQSCGKNRDSERIFLIHQIKKFGIKFLYLLKYCKSYNYLTSKNNSSINKYHIGDLRKDFKTSVRNAKYFLTCQNFLKLLIKVPQGSF